MRWRILTAVVLTMSLGRSVAAQERFDGEFWTKASSIQGDIGSTARLMFATGLLAGLRTAPALIVVNDDNGGSLPALQAYLSKHTQTMPSRQLLDGLDSFYSDYANRRIMIYEAAAVVLRRMAGDDDGQVSAWVTSLREKASKGQ